MSMKDIFDRWDKFLVEEQSSGALGRIPPETLKFLVANYAKNPNGRVNLTIGYFRFSELEKTPFEKEFINVGGAYIPTDKNRGQSSLIMLNAEHADVKDKNVKSSINTVIHEIEHYNQHMNWNKDDESKLKFVGNAPLPAGYTKNNIDYLSFYKLLEFWVDHYAKGDANNSLAPHEIDANAFATAHTEEAIQKVIKRNEKMIKNRRMHIVNKEQINF